MHVGRLRLYPKRKENSRQSRKTGVSEQLVVNPSPVRWFIRVISMSTVAGTQNGRVTSGSEDKLIPGTWACMLSSVSGFHWYSAQVYRRYDCTRNYAQGPRRAQWPTTLKDQNRSTPSGRVAEPQPIQLNLETGTSPLLSEGSRSSAHETEFYQSMSGPFPWVNL